MRDVNRLKLLRRIVLVGGCISAAKTLLIGAADTRCVDLQQELLTLVHERLIALDQEIAELQLLRSEIESYQQRLFECQPDEHEPFSMCRDMSCIAVSSEAN